MFMRTYKEVRLIGRGKHPVRPNNVIVFNDNIEIHDHPQINGGWKDHILVKRPTPELEQAFEKAGCRIHRPFGKGHIDVYLHSPQTTYDAFESTKRIVELGIIVNKILK